MKKLCKILGVNQSLDDDIKVKVNSALKDEDIQYGRKVLKLIVSEKILLPVYEPILIKERITKKALLLQFPTSEEMKLLPLPTIKR